MQNSPASTGAKRLGSLDVLRGLTMAFMVLVGNPGSAAIYTQFDHAPWNGLTITDLVFPTFLWIVGFSIQLSFSRQLDRGATWPHVLLSMSRRCAILFLLGIALYAITDFHLATFRILGVLQRIAICSFVASTLFRFSVRTQLAFIVIVLGSYAVTLRWAHAPGHVAGDLSIAGNVAHYIDRMVLGRHNYAGTGDWDPEGILSTLPAIATTVIGLLSARVFQRRHACAVALMRRFVLAGFALITTGLCLNIWQPINKKLWAPSFCLLSAGVDLLLIALLYWRIDVRSNRRGTLVPIAFGQNSLAIYLFSEAVGALLYRIRWNDVSLHQMIFQSLFAGRSTPQADSLFFALSYLAMVTVVATVAYKQRWIIKL